MPRANAFHCKFCHSAIKRKGLCDTCAAYFKRRREEIVCRCSDCSGQGYSVTLPPIGPGESFSVTVRRNPVES